jgi:hypothetical protein
VLFQALDNKQECAGVYHAGELYFEKLPEGLTKTWNVSGLTLNDVEYAHIYSGGESMMEACPENLKIKWENLNYKFKAYLNSFKHAKISLHEHCFFDLVPHRFLLEYYSVADKITEYVFETYEKPANYDFLVELTKFTDQLSRNRLALDQKALRPHMANLQARNLWNKFDTLSPYIRYNPFGTVTGRLSTSSNSFPILTLPKELRTVVKPKNDWLVEVDYNAAELRTLLALSGKEQPSEDLHEWNRANVYKDVATRDEAKKRIFSWLYNPNSNDQLSSRIYERNKVKTKYYDGTHVTTDFGRKIECEGRVALNYIIQSTTSDLVMSKVIEINKMLSETNSRILFTMHDSFVIDLCNKDKSMLKEILRKFSDTRYGEYRVNLSIGRDFSSMEEIEWNR